MDDGIINVTAPLHDDNINNDLTTHIVKGKRTKRSRPQSPIPPHNNTDDVYSYHDDVGGIITCYSNSPSPPNSTTEEDEDTAKCLILLSQQGSTEELGCKFSSKRYIETTIVGGVGKAGMYVYECKTCNRTFPSFQALGGHRASHKKPKQHLLTTMTRPSNFIAEEDDHQQQFNSNNINVLSLQLGNSNNNRQVQVVNKSAGGGGSNKIHECAICGAEFTSGQALGGHMRRHRNPVQLTSVAANTALSLSPTITPINAIQFHSNFPPHEKRQHPKTSAAAGFCLDLNLPASPGPDEERDHHHHHHQEVEYMSNNMGESKRFPQISNSNTNTNTIHQHHHQQQQQKQQSSIVLSAAPTLVDCHY